MNLEDLLNEIYSREINIEITTFWDAGYSLRIGDCINGFKKKETYLCGDMNELKVELIKLIKENDEYNKKNLQQNS